MTHVWWVCIAHCTPSEKGEPIEYRPLPCSSGTWSYCQHFLIWSFRWKYQLVIQIIPALWSQYDTHISIKKSISIIQVYLVVKHTPRRENCDQMPYRQCLPSCSFHHHPHVHQCWELFCFQKSCPCKHEQFDILYFVYE